jgi:D-serine deaminase-like pyridoxal phosphate-dependent protein
VELDLGMRRVGVQFPSAAIALAQEIGMTEAVEYRGITFYPGHVRSPVGEQGSALSVVSARLAEFIEQLSDAGFRPRVVSDGSNIFNDRNTVALGACPWSACAYSVLATVVSTAIPGQAVIDAGAKALAKEEGLAPGGEYGALLDRPDVVVRSLSEEHGLLDLSGTEWRPRVGERVQVVLAARPCKCLSGPSRSSAPELRTPGTWPSPGLRTGAGHAPAGLPPPRT